MIDEKELWNHLNDNRTALFVVLWCTLMFVGAVYTSYEAKQKYDDLQTEMQEQGCSVLYENNQVPEPSTDKPLNSEPQETLNTNEVKQSYGN